LTPMKAKGLIREDDEEVSWLKARLIEVEEEVRQREEAWNRQIGEEIRKREQVEERLREVEGTMEEDREREQREKVE